MSGGPQLENGYTRIANELLEAAARFKLNGTQFRLVLSIWRNTYGYNLKEHALSISFLAEAINVSRRQVDRELTSLIERNVVKVVSGGPRSTRKLMVNKHYEEWVPEICTRNGGQNETVVQLDDTLSSKKTTELYTKRRYKKDKRQSINTSGFYSEIISYLNQKTGKRYSAKSEANKKLINGRISEGRTLEDFIYVIDVKVNHWLNDPKMKKYLQPSTLFRPGNFEKYLNQEPNVSEEDKEAKRKEQERQQAYDDALREWVMAGNDPEHFRYDGSD